MRITVEFIEAFKGYYSRFDQRDFSELDTFYTHDVTFSDPLHKIVGLDNVKRYFTDMCGGLLSCQFRFVGQTVDDDSAWLKWVMSYQHPTLNGGNVIELTGASYIRLVQTPEGIRAASHEDFYDMGAMVYEHIPMLKVGIRWLKKQLLKAST